MWVEQRFSHCADMTQALAREVGKLLASALSRQGRASLAVSGGRSPVALFRELSQMALDWHRVSITLVDERCVDPTSANSNAALVREHLLQHHAAQARFVDWITPELWQAHGHDPRLLADACETRLQSSLAWPLDIVLLGMGADGHTASIFPFSLGASHALDSQGYCVWVEPGKAPHTRLTLTLSRILQACDVLLQIAGADKLMTYQQAKFGTNPAYPVSHVLCQSERKVQVWIGESA